MTRFVVPPSGGTAGRAIAIGAPSGAGAAQARHRRSIGRFTRIPPEGGATSDGTTSGGRRGASLVELLVVIAVAGVLISLSSTTIHVLLRSERDQARAVRTAMTVSRLTQVFRADVHATSQSAIVADEGQPPRLALNEGDGRQIVYTGDENALRRVENVQGTEVHRDLFRFPPGSAVTFERDDTPSVVRVLIDLVPMLPRLRPEQARLARPRTLSIEAVSNRDHRFARREP